MHIYIKCLAVCLVHSKYSINVFGVFFLRLKKKSFPEEWCLAKLSRKTRSWQGEAVRQRRHAGRPRHREDTGHSGSLK